MPATPPPPPDAKKSRAGTWITLAAVAAFAALLYFSTLSAQKAECEVCVTFNGQTNCATASAASEAEAARSAQNTACGPLASGMDEVLKCDRIPPAKRVCSTK